MAGLRALQKKYQFNYSKKQRSLLKTIQRVYEQQHELLYGNREQVKQRIVSLHKPHVRPIVRGKEVKPVEFGAKVHKVQIDGLSFIEHISFDNFRVKVRDLKLQ